MIYLSCFLIVAFWYCVYKCIIMILDFDDDYNFNIMEVVCQLIFGKKG